LIFKNNISQLYVILPYIFLIENKYHLIFSILTARRILKIKNQVIEIPRSMFSTVLACLTYTISYSLDSSKILKISFDENSLFEISLNNLSIDNNIYSSLEVDI
jgi:hypothetical protein